MEAKILIIGIVFLIYSRIAKKQKDKSFFDKKNNTAIFYSIFWAIIAVIISYMAMLNIATDEGSLGEDPAKSALICIVAFVCGGLYGYIRVKKTHKKTDKFIRTALEWADAIYPVAFISAFIMYVFIQQFKIPSPSMKMTFVEGDRLFVNKLIYGVKVPFTNKKILKQKDVSRGDIVIFRFPAKSRKEMYCGGSQYGKDFIKRVIGIAGDEIKVEGRQVFVNNKPIEEPYARWTDDYRVKPVVTFNAQEFEKIWLARQTGEAFDGYIRDNFGPVKVPPNNYFVMGDNRDHSCDGRFWGPVPFDNIKGRAWLIVWPPARFKNVNNNSQYKNQGE